MRTSYRISPSPPHEIKGEKVHKNGCIEQRCGKCLVRPTLQSKVFKYSWPCVKRCWRSLSNTKVHSPNPVAPELASALTYASPHRSDNDPWRPACADPYEEAATASTDSIISRLPVEQQPLAKCMQQLMQCSLQTSLQPFHQQVHRRVPCSCS